MSNDVGALKGQLAVASTAAALAFLTDHASDVKVLGEDKVKAFLKAALHEVLPLPVLPPGATLEQIAAAQEAAEARRTEFDLVAEAEATDAEIAARLRKDALDVAKKLAGMAFTGVLGLGLKAAMGM